MAKLGIQNYNRIIDIYFLNKYDMPVKFIKCARRGRKPTIEINGNLYAGGSIPVFNITIKNLYLELTKELIYPKIKVVAGYENNTTEIVGTILTMYQEGPGPEGTTVIQCIQGQMQNWMNTYIQLEYEAGTPIVTPLTKIATTLGLNPPRFGKKAGTLPLKEKLLFDGMARNAIDKLTKMFEDEELAIVQRNNTLCAFSIKNNDFIEAHKLEYISAPPQMNTGDEAGANYTTVTAPWMPKLNPGDLLEIPAWAYMKNFTLVGLGKNKQRITVTAIQFHFSTTGGANSMTVQGYKS